MKVREPHPWNVSTAEARRLQEDLRGKLRLQDAVDPEAIRLVAGVDNAYRRDAAGSTAHAVVVVMRVPQIEIVETSFATLPVTFPYVPGLLTFREGPAVLEAFAKLTIEPDVVLFDGQGLAHPRRIGLASHLGVLLDRPTIGCAKSRLIGRYHEPGEEFGAWTPLVDKSEIVGAAVRTKPGHAPLFVSPGNHVTVSTAVRIVLACCRGHFMPEPTRLAHTLVTEHKKAVLAQERP